MRALPLAAVAALGFAVFWVSTMTAEVRGLVAGTIVPPEEDELMEITYTKTLPDGTVATLTVTPLDGETEEEFIARATRLLKLWCDSLGM